MSVAQDVNQTEQLKLQEQKVWEAQSSDEIRDEQSQVDMNQSKFRGISHQFIIYHKNYSCPALKDENKSNPYVED